MQTTGSRKGVNLSTYGLALIEVLIAAGTMMTVTLAIAALLIQVQKENKALSQKLDVVHLDQQITRYLTNPTSCGCMFQNTVLNSTTKDVSPLKAGCPNPNPPPNLAATGEPLNGSSSVKVESVTLNNIMTISGSVKAADLEITFDQSNLVIPLKNVTLNGILFQVNADQTIAGCGGNLAEQQCQDYTSSYIYQQATVSCPSDYPNPLRGGCNSNCSFITVNEIVGSTQTCKVVTELGSAYCVYAGQRDVSARITCCK